MLTDTFGRHHTYLRISLTERCNLRCQYCMPADGVPLSPKSSILSFEEIVRIVNLFVRHGVTKLRLTGGEPLVRKDAVELTEQLGQIDGLQTFAITTNGLLLESRIDRLVGAGVNLMNISLDTLKEKRFVEITRRKGLDTVLAAIHRAVNLPGLQVKVNVVAMKGVNDDELIDFVRMTKDLPMEVRFIEYMPFAGNGWRGGAFLSFEQMLAIIRQKLDLIPCTDLPSETARTFSVPGFAGKVGFIASMSQPFCEGCNRLRITADGNLKVCLFGHAEVSLRDALRSGATDQEMASIISDAVLRKKARHAGLKNLVDLENRPMILIGG